MRDDGTIRFPRVAAMFVAVYFAALGVLVAAGRLPAVLVGWIALASIAAYLAYRADKRRAQRSARRIPEQTLHLLSLLGGWPGALVAQWRLRHKNRKLAFQFVFWLLVAVNLLVVYTLASRR